MSSYSGERIYCPKCYGGAMGEPWYCSRCLDHWGERLHRRCPSCGYRTTEPCADAAKADDKQQKLREFMERNGPWDTRGRR